MTDYRTVRRTERKNRANVINASPGSVTVHLEMPDYDRFMSLVAEFKCTRSALTREMVLVAMDNPEYLRSRLEERAFAEAAAHKPKRLSVKALRVY